MYISVSGLEVLPSMLQLDRFDGITFGALDLRKNCRVPSDRVLEAALCCNTLNTVLKIS